jgi:hypothetical protein
MVALLMEGGSIKFGEANGENILSVVAAIIPTGRVSSIGRRMALCIVRIVGEYVECSRLSGTLETSNRIIYISRSVEFVRSCSLLTF